ncbi:hypothetical protein [Streptomyces gibsoniae]|uniref:Uncharacterized protein n=1 Tax=Streptomyces gibsoniae TaxID=3075529 RepID=A0ABU2U7B4_9ACTN|nr:hypothetical protein [Streptomyces sp. DSM 41699]MDT0469113.1 hypothetical protein [Streptomyces sp. DSM 41699]
MGVPAFESADPLDDILAVPGRQLRMRTQDVIYGLADLNPHEYGGWSFRDLRRVLDDCGHGEYTTGGGVMHVSRQRIVEAIADREADSEGDADDEI